MIIIPVFQTRGITPNSSADKMRKLLSPGTKKKFVGGQRTFGVPLVELVNRAPKGCRVPYIVKKLCTYMEHNGKTLLESVFQIHLEVKMSLVMRKPAFCICENKDADQLRGNREADQCLCFRYIDSTIPLLSKYEISCL